MNENWLTGIFNNYLGGVGNAILGLFNVTAKDPAHPWETWLVMELLVVAILVVLIAIVRASLSVDRPGKLQHIFESLTDFLESQAADVGIHHPEKYLNLFGTLFIFILAMNLIGVIPAFESPTMTVYGARGAGHVHLGLLSRHGTAGTGPGEYLEHFLGPMSTCGPVDDPD